jgi:hypothetical protein
MLMYRAASFFARMYASDMLLGMHSTEEIIDGGGTAQVSVAEQINETLDKETGVIDTVYVEQTPVANDQTVDEAKNYRTRPKVINAFKAEIDDIKSSLHLDRWRMKHSDRIIRSLPKEEDQKQVFSYAGDKFQELLTIEKEANNTPPTPEKEPDEQATDKAEDQPALQVVNCPDSKEQVSVGYCDTRCKKRSGCPAFDE